MHKLVFDVCALAVLYLLVFVVVISPNKTTFDTYSNSMHKKLIIRTNRMICIKREEKVWINKSALNTLIFTCVHCTNVITIANVIREYYWKIQGCSEYLICSTSHFQHRDWCRCTLHNNIVLKFELVTKKLDHHMHKTFVGQVQIFSGWLIEISSISFWKQVNLRICFVLFRFSLSLTSG